MKKFLTLMLAAGMVFSAANGASAVEMKVSGQWMASFNFTDNLFSDEGLVKDGESGKFSATQRLRINLDMVASESLSARVQLQAGKYHWGNGVNGVGEAGSNVTARIAYLDWMIPTTDVLVRMGRQLVTMPSYTFGSPVFSDNPIDGILINAPINDMVGVTFGWLRPQANAEQWGTAHTQASNIDLAYLSVDVAADGFKVTPWGMIGVAGRNTVDNPMFLPDGSLRAVESSYFGVGGRVADINDDGTLKTIDSNTMLYWVGLGGELTLFDPFKFTADFIYSGNDADGYAERDGWYAALGAEMKTAYATPFLRGWYASGDDADSKGSNRMLTLGEGNGAFDASGVYFDTNVWMAGTIDRTSPAGTWGVQLGVKDVSFIEDLTHDLSVSYFQGTNNTNRLTGDSEGLWTADRHDVTYMTTKDSAWSIDFASSYKLYKNLSARLMLSYLVTDFDEGIRTVGTDKAEFDNAFRGTLNFNYTF